MSGNNDKGGGRKGGFRRESILELSKWMDAKVRVKCLGGRELEGTLKGYDDLVNLVLDDCDEYLRGESVYTHTHQINDHLSLSLCMCLSMCTVLVLCTHSHSHSKQRRQNRGFPICSFPTDPEDWQTVTDKTRKLGLVVIRGTQVSLVSPHEGMEEIANPFVQAEGGGEDDDNDDDDDEEAE